MNFDLSDEQQMLQDSAQRFVQKDYTFEHRRKLAAHGGGFSRDMWRAFGEMGEAEAQISVDQRLAIAEALSGVLDEAGDRAPPEIASGVLPGF